ncbi:hypothetical protein [Pseudomonas sp. XK-1]|uniref:hypothetical protein n=1 Tax=Pseudomonas sp. XK-1 TaxID=3136019 RepID=UPI0031191305
MKLQARLIMNAKEMCMLPDEVTIKFNPKLLLVSPPAAFLAISLYFLPWSAVTAPAWVQAFGSIAAIVAAFLVAERSHARDRESARMASLENDLRAAKLVESAAHEAASSVQGIYVQLQSGSAFLHRDGISTLRLIEADKTLRSLLTQPLSPGVIGCIFIIINHLAEVFLEIKQWPALGPSNLEVARGNLLKRQWAISDCRSTIEQDYLRIAGLIGTPVSIRPVG